MRHPRRLAVAVAILIFVVTFGEAARWPAQAANGRDFAGFYTLSDASAVAGGYTLTLTAKIFNYSGTDVIDATILLRGGMPPEKAYASFEHINIDATRSARVSAQVTVPAFLYDRWQKGGRPELIIQFTNAKGEKQSERVDLAPDHAGLETREE